MSKRFVRWAANVRNLSPAELRTECDSQLAREQRLGKVTSGFVQGIHAVQALLEGGLPNTAAMATFDDDTRQALLSIAQQLNAQCALSQDLLTAERTAFTTPQKPGKRFREFVARAKGLPPAELRETIAREMCNLEATNDTGRYFQNLAALKTMLSGSPTFDLTGYRRKLRALFRDIADQQVAQGGLSYDVLSRLSEADRQTEALLSKCKAALKSMRK
jgi:hypothetical protein